MAKLPKENQFLDLSDYGRPAARLIAQFFKPTFVTPIHVTILFIISGLLNPVMHMSYVSFAFIYLIPILFNYISIKTFFKRFLLIGLILFTLNIIYLILFSGGLNLSSLWR